MKKKGSLFKTIFIMLIIAVIIVFGYYKVINKDSDKKVESDYISTNLETVLAKNLEEKYPPTAREVIKLYARILVLLYGGEGEITDEQAEALVDITRQMYSEKLIEENPRDTHIENLLEEIRVYRGNGVIIYDYIVEKSDSAITWSDENGEYYRLIASFALKSEGYLSRVYQQFILIKEDSHWKILGWTDVDKEEMDVN